MKFFRHIVLLTPCTLALGLLFLTVSAAAADTRWTSVGSQEPGSSDRPVWSIAVSPAHPSVILAATQGHGVVRSTDSGATWTSVISSAENAWSIRFDPQLAGAVYAGTQRDGLYKSSDEGKTWSAASQGLSSMDVRAIDAGNGLIVVGTAQGVFYSNDAAVSWHSLGLSGLSIAAVGLLPKASGMTIFAGADNGSSPLGGYLLKTDDLSGSWVAVKGSFPGDAVVASLAVASGPSGGTAAPVLAGTSQGLFRSDDRGTTWAPLGGLPTSDFNVGFFNPANPDQIYAGSDADQGNGGVYRIADPAASIAGASPGATAVATSRASASARATIPAPVPVRRSSGSIAYQPYAAAAAILLALIAVILFRRWRIRREDRRTYAP